jgi:hypothetical protein
MRPSVFGVIVLLAASTVHAQTRSPWGGWGSAIGTGATWEVVVGNTVAFDPQRSSGYVGATARVGVRWTFGSGGRSVSGHLLAAFLGQGFGLDVRAHAWIRPGATGEVIAAFGVAPTSYAFVGRPVETSILRTPSVLGAAAPELGLGIRADGELGFYLGWDVPVGVLVSRRVAIELPPSTYLIDGFGLREGANLLLSLGLTATIR